MNRIHHRICQSADWFAKVEQQTLPWALDGLDLGSKVLEIGPGFGATTRVLARTVPDLTAVEIDVLLARRLREQHGDRVAVVHGDGTRLPFDDESFDSVVCFTMLHHVPSARLQDRLFGEAFRVLRGGGVFAGCDSRPTLRWRILHVGDIGVPVNPATLPGRLEAAGFAQASVATARTALKFQAAKP
ncbi:hypothetical protein Cs7R123_09270 [Catellatospora sp. TT07R-123]|uniref:class I SAM-dependent methyltransferase n=1 Tax=Catellatospora sp. TT07R-123 TaxID=2733863 RepID=UPI001B16010D|nr:class I SAM-dependent methyltransferase [Catellatospora sp. TT07R-123]GHJ43585.1 hypothetical protein Cs7R123_09270 [Catellatospora sp. TT07R-123]